MSASDALPETAEAAWASQSVDRAAGSGDLRWQWSFVETPDRLKKNGRRPGRGARDSGAFLLSYRGGSVFWKRVRWMRSRPRFYRGCELDLRSRMRAPSDHSASSVSPDGGW